MSIEAALQDIEAIISERNTLRADVDRVSLELGDMTQERNGLLARVVEVEKQNEELVRSEGRAVMHMAETRTRCEELEARLTQANENATCWAALGEIEGLLGISGKPPVTTAVEAIREMQSNFTAAMETIMELQQEVQLHRRERSSDLDAGEFAVDVAKKLKEQRDRTAAQLDAMREQLDCTPPHQNSPLTDAPAAP